MALISLKRVGRLVSLYFSVCAIFSFPLVAVEWPVFGYHLGNGPLFKDLYSCPIEIINGLNDKGLLKYLTGLKGPQEGTYLYNTQFLTLRLISIFYQKIP